MNPNLFKIGNSWWTTALVVAGSVALVYVVVRHGQSLRRFFGEVSVELKKCSWPWDPDKKGMSRYRELIDSTCVVIVSTILLAAFVTCSDFLLMKVIGRLTNF